MESSTTTLPPGRNTVRAARIVGNQYLKRGIIEIRGLVFQERYS
jgi:hypothetical protein